MEPGATYTQMLTQLREHLGSAFKQPTCNWGHKSYSWMNDGLLRQATDCWPGMDGWMDGCNRNNAASDACTACDRKNSMCTVCASKCTLQGRVVTRGYHKIQVTCLWSCPEDTVHGGRLFLRCDAAGSASFIDSYITLSHAPLWNLHVLEACVSVARVSRRQEQFIFYFFGLQSVHRGK